jgi:two-component system, NtrC family, response regulator
VISVLYATNKNLKDETKYSRFRHDLYYRINIFPIPLTPLRERFNDLTGIVRQLISDTGSYNIQISREVITFLQKYTWPGNVRELKNVLERALVLAQGGSISIEHFRGIETTVTLPCAQKGTVSDLELNEEQHIMNVIKRSGGNKIKAAEALGISKSALYRKIKKFSRPI